MERKYQTQQIDFTDNGIEYIVNVTYTVDTYIPREYMADLIKPIKIKSIAQKSYTGFFYAMGTKNKTFAIDKDDSLVDKKKYINIYDDVIENVIYQYINRDKILLVKRKCKEYNEMIDEQYKEQIQVLSKRKSSQKQKLKNGAITQNEYKKTLDSIIDIKNQKSVLKSQYKNQFYDECCKIKG